jgi:hypothetical protein
VRHLVKAALRGEADEEDSMTDAHHIPNQVDGDLAHGGGG